jgi:hypothetical protein
MRRAEPGPDVLATLEAVDATLAGEPVHPAFADVAELALLVSAERPAPEPEFARKLDGRVEQRFKPAAPAETVQARPRRLRRLSWSLAPVTGLAALVAVVVVLPSGGGGSSVSSSSAVRSAPHAQSLQPKHSPGTASRAQKIPSAPLSRGNIPAPTFGLHVPNSGRKQVQSSQLTLGALPKRIDTVAQEVFNVVGEQNGFVDSSDVTAGGVGGYAHFQLSVPSVSLPQTMSALSSVAYAKVLQRTDSVEDVTSQYRNAVRHHDKKAIKALQQKIAFSQVTVNVQAEALAPAVHRPPHQSGFIPDAAHTALHVLTVIAGVALIALAVLVPLALVAALAWWVTAAFKRRRREQALDMA